MVDKEANWTPETMALDFAVAIHKDWHNAAQVAFYYRQFKFKCLSYGYHYDTLLKRLGDYLRECFDREPKTRDIPLEEATTNLQQWLTRMSLEM